jgi:hypothetical protein
MKYSSKRITVSKQKRCFPNLRPDRMQEHGSLLHALFRKKKQPAARQAAYVFTVPIMSMSISY